MSLRSINEEEIISTVALPTTTGLDSDNEGINSITITPMLKIKSIQMITWIILLLDDLDEVDNSKKVEKSFETADQLSEQMITLSLLPKSKWQNLLNLELIKVFMIWFH